MLIVGWFALVVFVIVRFLVRAGWRLLHVVGLVISAAMLALLAACAGPPVPAFGSGAWAGHTFKNQLGVCGDRSVPLRFKELGCYD